MIALGPETIRLIVYEKTPSSPVVRQLPNQFGQLNDQAQASVIRDL
jgi:hypothetical protein